MSIEIIMKSLETVEKQLDAFSQKAEAEQKAKGKVDTDTKAALDQLGVQQRELADRMLKMEQADTGTKEDAEVKAESWGSQVVKADAFRSFATGQTQKMRVEVKNTVTNVIGNTFSERVGFVGGAFREFTLESLLNTLTTTAPAIDYVREDVFTNSAAETAEGAVKPESAVTTALVTKPVSTVAHFIKISRQLSMDNQMLAAYIDRRMRYGVNLRVENQIVAGNGAGANIGGFTLAGNFTAHGYTAASLTGAGLLNNRFDLIGKIIGDTQLADYPADVIVVNPADWWTMRLSKDSQGRYLLGDPGASVAPNLFGIPVVSSNAMTAANVLIMNIGQAATFYNREGVVVEMSDSDGDNFQRNLITLRAERRCLLAVERPAAVRYGLLVPA